MAKKTTASKKVAAPKVVCRKPRAVDPKAIKASMKDVRAEIKEAKAALKPLTAEAKAACKAEDKGIAALSKLGTKLAALAAKLA